MPLKPSSAAEAVFLIVKMPLTLLLLKSLPREAYER